MAGTTDNCQTIGKPTTQRTLDNAFRAHGFSTMLGGLLNSFPYNVFTQNIGLIALEDATRQVVTQIYKVLG
ncbi:solute carrier family 23 protein [Pseudomonas sp. SC3(2021)]|uniref:solute carrier family 23 protein n=1 Tax=Pseudomonas sp. SC3(2021) TaxID=2871493 RepID=UPI001C9D9718